MPEDEGVDVGDDVSDWLRVADSETVCERVRVGVGVAPWLPVEVVEAVIDRVGVVVPDEEIVAERVPDTVTAWLPEAEMDTVCEAVRDLVLLPVEDCDCVPLRLGDCDRVGEVVEVGEGLQTVLAAHSAIPPLWEDSVQPDGSPGLLKEPRGVAKPDSRVSSFAGRWKLTA